MKATTLKPFIISALTVMAALSTTLKADFPQDNSSNEVWRTDLASFGKELLAVTLSAKIPDEFQLLQSIRERAVFSGADGYERWVILLFALDGELHGELTKRFTGKIAWRGNVNSIEKNDAGDEYIILIDLPLPVGKPEYLDVRSIQLSISAATLQAGNIPTKGAPFSFTGMLKDQTSDELWRGVWHMYGVGINSPKVIIGVDPVDVRPDYNDDSRAEELWSDAKVATLTFTVKQKSEASLEASKFPKRDYAKKFNDALQAITKEVENGGFVKALALRGRIEYSELVVDKDKGEVRVVFMLYRVDEKKWPKGDESIEVQVWGVRKPANNPLKTQNLATPLLKYDLILRGKTQRDGVIKGKMTGVIFVDKSRSSFSNIDFELKPGQP